jgi:hypothetical protein
MTTAHDDPVIFRFNFVYPDGTPAGEREMRLRELTFTLVEAASFEINEDESLKDRELSQDAEASACEGLPTFKETLASLTLGENDLESLVFFDFAHIFANTTQAMTMALMDADALFVKAYGGYIGARIVLQEHAQGVRMRSEAEVMALCRIAFRTLAYMRRAIRAATEETASIRAQLNEGEIPAEKVSPAALTLLTVPTREVIAALGSTLFSKKQSAKSKGRRSEALEFARAEFERMYQSGGDTKDAVLAKMIVERMAQAQIAKPVADGTVSRYIPGWRSDIEQRLRVAK